MLRNKLMTACSVALLTAALYGCSSSSDDGANMKVQDLQDQISALEGALGEGQELTPETLAALVSDLETADGRVTELETMIGDETDPAAESLRGMLAQANMDLGEARTALEIAMDNSADEMVIAGLRQDVTDAEGTRDSYKTMLDTANADLVTVTKERDDAMTELAELRKTAADLLAAGALKEKIARAGQVHTTIGADPGGAVPKMVATAGGVTGVTATRNAADLVAVDVNGSAADDDYTGGETNAGSSTWNRVTMTKTNADDDSTDMVVIYTDIEAPSDMLFTERYDQGARDDIFASDTLADRLKLAQSDSFPSGPSTTLTYGETGGLPKSFAGTFDGVPGNFVCTDTTCSVTTNAMGKLTSVTGTNWRFSPTAPNDATVKEPDAAYAYFGWWLNKPVKADTTHGVEVFAGAVGVVAEIGDAIVGTATYAGPAAGKYATKTFTAGVQTDAAVGHFTATANLTAKFGNADGQGDGISGTVTGFELDDMNAVPWKVVLEMAEYSGANFTGTTEVDFGGGVTDTPDDGVGDWQGTFYGAGAEPADAPSTVVGTFGAAVENARVLGAFGATKQ